MKDIWAAMEAGEIIIGHWMASGSPAMVELLGRSGADAVAIDCEHGPVSPYGGELQECIRAAYAADVAPLVRIAARDGSQVSRAADLGAKGVIVPHVNTPEQLRDLIAHVKLPPLGNRGCAPMVPAAGYGWTPWRTFAAETNDGVEVVPLFEEPAAFENLDALLAVDGVRAVAIGPFDLAARLGGVDDPEAQPQVRDYSAGLLAACTARGISVIDGAWDAETVGRKVAAGARGILYSGDTSLLVAALREHRAAIDRALASVPR